MFGALWQYKVAHAADVKLRVPEADGYTGSQQGMDMRSCFRETEIAGMEKCLVLGISMLHFVASP